MRDPKSKLKCDTEQQLKDAASKPYFYRVQIINWDGPGWYYIFKYDQPCPRGCCRDNVFEAISKKKWEQRIVEEIRDLAYQLREVRSLK
jgi:hypothetical protein